MSTYGETYANGFGISTFGNVILSRGITALDYSIIVPGENEDESLSVGLANGSLFEFLPFSVPNTIFTSIYLKFVQGMPYAFNFELNRMPNFPLVKNTEFSIRIGNTVRFKGYITKTPNEGEDERLVFEGFGYHKKIEKKKIVNSDRHIIQSTTQSGSSNTLIFLGTPFASSALVGLKVVISDNIEDKNNGVFEITSNATNTITVLNPSGITSTAITGIVEILPAEWTNSTLVSDLVKQILSTNFGSGGNPNYIESKIEETSGILTAGEINWAGTDFPRFMKIVREICEEQYYFGIDGQGSFFLTKISDEQIEKFHAGYSFPSATLETDNEIQANTVTVYRSDAKSGRRKLSVIAGLASDATSIAKEGAFDYTEDVPAYVSDATGQAYAEALLTILKQPVVKGKAEKMPYRWYDFGFYGYVSQSGFYTFDLADFDSLTSWTTDANITASLSNTVLVNGANSHKLELTSASIGETHVRSGLNFRITGAQKLLLFINNTEEIEIRIGIGNTVWNEKTYDLKLKGLSRFEPIPLDISGYSGSKIDKLGFEILNCGTQITYLDYATVYQYGAKHYSMKLDELELHLQPHEKWATLTFGDQKRNGGYAELMAGVKAQIELQRMMIRES